MATYTTQVLSSRGEIAAIAEEWKTCWAAQGDRCVRQHPSFMRIELERDPDDRVEPMVVTLRDRDRLVGVAPLVIRATTWPCRVGYTEVAAFPLRLGELCGSTFVVPPDPDAQDALLAALGHAGCPDVIGFENVAITSSLYDRLRHSPVARAFFWIRQSAPATPHHLLALPASFEAYITTTLSASVRRRVERGLRAIDRAFDGELVVERVTERDQVDGFLEAVERIWAASWQGRRLRPIRATRARRERLRQRAELGWLRSYLLRGRGEPLAFVLGIQADGTYHFETPAFDERWSKLAPGRALLHRLIEDLFRFAPPTRLDFGHGDAEYKRWFSNQSYEDANVELVRKTAYLGVARACQSAFDAFGKGVRAGLDRIGMRERVRRLLRTSAPTVDGARGTSPDRPGPDP